MTQISSSVFGFAGDRRQRRQQQAPLLHNPVSVQTIDISWGEAPVCPINQCFSPQISSLFIRNILSVLLPFFSPLFFKIFFCCFCLLICVLTLTFHSSVTLSCWLCTFYDPTAKTERSIDCLRELAFIRETCWPKIIYAASFCYPKQSKACTVYCHTLWQPSAGACVPVCVSECRWDYSVWRVLRAIYRCNYKLERLFPPCWENEESVEVG